MLDRCHTRLHTVVDLDLADPVLDTGLGDSEVLRDLRKRHLTPPRDRDDIVSELPRIRPRHDCHPSSGNLRHHRSGVTSTFSSPNVDAYEWDAEGELASDDDYTYAYDTSGNRIVRNGDDGTTVYLPGGQEVTIDGSVITASRYYAFGGKTVAMRTGSGLGSVTSLVSDRDGTVAAAIPNTEWTASSVERVYSDPFGDVRGATDSDVPGDRRFLGATRDDGSGLTLLGARYYDSAIGRFISVDPLLDIGLPAHFNAYAYGYNNPPTFSDPTGAMAANEYGGGGGGGTTSGSSGSSRVCPIICVNVIG